MTTETKVRKIGNSLGIVLPKEAIQAMKVKEGTTLYLTEGPESSLHVTPSLFQCAAAYAHGIVNNNAFMDGNKCTGFMAAYIFLGINGYELDATEEQAVLETLGLAAGTSSEPDYAAWLERSCNIKAMNVPFQE